jgi:TolA-binding protein
MKKTTLTFLFTFAILAGLAAAPDAQTFRWEPNNHRDSVDSRVQRAVEQARRTLERTMDRIHRDADRRASLMERQIRVRVNTQVRQQVQREVQLNQLYTRDFGRSMRDVGRSMRGERYADMQVGGDADPCRTDNWGNDEYEQHCEVRDSTLPAGALNVDAGQNGGIVVEGWDRNEIRVRAIVRGQARESARARELVSQVQVQAGGGRVYATGPDSLRRESWSVSYRINVPRKNDLDLRANNGGVTIVGVQGNMRFDTTNGGVKLQDIGGRVNGETRNGGLNVMLSGDRWDGEGLDVETSNGGVTLSLPDNYNAELETRTVNGGLRIDFPITVQGELTGRKGLQTTLGSGGPLVRVRTTNGGVKISKR